MWTLCAPPPQNANCIPWKMCNHTKPTLRPSEWHLEMEKASANDCWDWIMRASGKAPQPASIQPSLTSSQEQLDSGPRGRSQCFQTASHQKPSWRSVIFMCLNVTVTGKSVSIDREWSAKTSRESTSLTDTKEPQQQRVTTHTPITTGLTSRASEPGMTNAVVTKRLFLEQSVDIRIE